VIVRISGDGQFELGDEAVKKLDSLDTRLTEALNAGDDAAFRSILGETVKFVEENGARVPADRVVPSQVIVPPADVDLDEARDFFTDEGLMEPLPA
jgi:hypothetical protein